MPSTNEYATESEVRAVPEPRHTETWRPHSHGVLIDAINHACEKVGIGVANREYSLARNGQRMFASYELEPFMRGSGRGFQLGFRQGLDKSMSVGVCAGLTVLICSNLVFDGEFVEFRKHTSGLDLQELQRIAIAAVSSSLTKMKDLRNWHDSLRTTKVMPLSCEFKALTFDAMTQGVFAPSQLKSFLESYSEERMTQGNAKKDPDNLYTWHGGVTRLLRGQSLLRISEANRVLNGLCDNFIIEGVV